MKIWIYTLVSVTFVSLLSLIGVFTIALRKERLQRLTLFLVSFAVGGLFGDAFIHLLPESFKKLGTGISTSLYIIFGLLIFFILEKFIRWRHCHIPTSSTHLHPVVPLNIIGDAVHNMIDGMIIGASYSIDINIGFATTLAVVLHEIPHEIGDFGVLVHGGLPVGKALLFNFLSALTAIFGAILSLLIGGVVEGYSLVLMPITAGGFIYIAGSDLIPELNQGCEITGRHALGQFLAIIFGIALMSLLLLLD